MITEPMLAGTCKDFALLKFPLLVTPKLDGIRCLKVKGQALSRKFLPIQNEFIRGWIEKNLPDGVDGELMVPGENFSTAAGLISRIKGEPNFRYHIFDYVAKDLTRPYALRMEDLATLNTAGVVGERVVRLLPKAATDLDILQHWEALFLEQGYEGLMARSPGSPYKCGRSTVLEGYLLKIKRFEDSEARILECIEGRSNQNEAGENAFGNTKRSTAKEGIVLRGELGSLKVVDLKTKVEFHIGFNHVKAAMDAKQAWKDRAKLLGRIIRYRYQVVGIKNAPRFPTFEGFREKWDL